MICRVPACCARPVVAMSCVTTLSQHDPSPHCNSLAAYPLRLLPSSFKTSCDLQFYLLRHLFLPVLGCGCMDVCGGRERHFHHDDGATLRLMYAECRPCASGTFSAGSGQTACASCPPNSDSPEGSDIVTQCACNPGFTGPNGTTCVRCEAGKYKNTAGSSDCTACPSNSDSPEGSDIVTNCTCIPGYSESADRECHDIDECETENGGCDQTCVNSAGSFTCSCGPGLTRSADQDKCEVLFWPACSFASFLSSCPSTTSLVICMTVPFPPSLPSPSVSSRQRKLECFFRSKLHSECLCLVYPFPQAPSSILPSLRVLFSCLLPFPIGSLA